MIDYEHMLRICGRIACMHVSRPLDSLAALHIALNYHDSDNRGIVAEKLLAILIEYIEQETDKPEIVKH